jgi:hypothetical protein
LDNEDQVLKGLRFTAESDMTSSCLRFTSTQKGNSILFQLMQTIEASHWLQARAAIEVSDQIF